MRVDKLRIGSDKNSPTHQFKNLKDVTVDFAQGDWITVIIGWNGTGKSNVLEALAVIFRELIGTRRSAPKISFYFELVYRIGPEGDERTVEVRHDPDEASQFEIVIKTGIGDGLVEDRVKLGAFLRDDRNLPKYVFSYYSGESPRMAEVFSPYVQWYDEQLRSGKDPGLKRLFYALPVHSQFVLLSFMLGGSAAVSDLLRDHLGIDPDDGLESVLFVLREPPWPPHPDGDTRFWGARGVVSKFLDRIMRVALAPIEVERRVPTSLWNEKTLNFKYLYVKDIQSLRDLVGTQPPSHFFRDLESTYVSQLIDEVRIKVKLSKNDGAVTFRELSEGEQQLLTVLGLLKFTAEEQSLFLLDEPDTHLNPKWSVDYLSFLKQFVGSSDDKLNTSHVILTTHNPLAIADLDAVQVQILHAKESNKRRSVVASFPEQDPRGMGYAAIVTSEMFGIASTLDRSTQVELEKQRLLAALDNLSEDQRSELDRLNEHLDGLGFRFFYPDDEYARYLKNRRRFLEIELNSTDVDVISGQVISMTLEEREALARRLVESMFDEQRALES